MSDDASASVSAESAAAAANTIYWYGGGQNVSWSYDPSTPVDCRWHLVQDVWALVDEADGEVLARVQEERGLWLVMVDADPVERYLSESQAKARAEEAAGPVNIVLPKRQNSSGIP
jgi:hypothetical protein